MGRTVRLVLPDQDEGARGEILDRIRGRGGGCTWWTGVGLWEGAEFREPIVIVECSLEHYTNIERTWWEKLAANAARLLDQQRVFLLDYPSTARTVDRDGNVQYVGVP